MFGIGLWYTTQSWELTTLKTLILGALSIAYGGLMHCLPLVSGSEICFFVFSTAKAPSPDQPSFVFIALAL